MVFMVRIISKIETSHLSISHQLVPPFIQRHSGTKVTETACVIILTKSLNVHIAICCH